MSLFGLQGLCFSALALGVSAAALGPELRGSVRTSSANVAQWPHIVPLSRESVPVKRNNQIVSYKTSYAGEISVGAPAKPFRVVFDTGSGNLVLPAAACTAQTCLEHQRYDVERSSTGAAINVDGTEVDPEEGSDQVDIGYGTGQITGEFAKDKVCLAGDGEACVEMNLVMAVEMTDQPFLSFNFDGIFGLGLSPLAVEREWSFFHNLARTAPSAQLQFGVYLTEGEDNEIALGGYNDARLLTPLQWAPVVKKDLGHWQVEIKEIRVNNKTLDVCGQGSCTGIVDTGTSHIGVPGAHMPSFLSQLSADGEGLDDCAMAEAPEIEVVLEGFTLTLTPENYMRKLAVPPDMNVGSKSGVTVTSAATQEDVNAAGHAAGYDAVKRKNGDGFADLVCRPRVMAVNLPAPIGPDLFILGEPFLQRYYTVYDWSAERVGFGLSATEKNEKALALAANKEQSARPIYSLVQVKVMVKLRRK